MLPGPVHQTNPSWMSRVTGRARPLVERLLADGMGAYTGLSLLLEARGQELTAEQLKPLRDLVKELYDAAADLVSLQEDVASAAELTARKHTAVLSRLRMKVERGGSAIAASLAAVHKDLKSLADTVGTLVTTVAEVKVTVTGMATRDIAAQATASANANDFNATLASVQEQLANVRQAQTLAVDSAASSVLALQGDIAASALMLVAGNAATSDDITSTVALGTATLGSAVQSLRVFCETLAMEQGAARGTELMAIFACMEAAVQAVSQAPAVGPTAVAAAATSLVPELPASADAATQSPTTVAAAAAQRETAAAAAAAGMAKETAAAAGQTATGAAAAEVKSNAAVSPTPTATPAGTAAAVTAAAVLVAAGGSAKAVAEPEIASAASAADGAFLAAASSQPLPAEVSGGKHLAAGGLSGSSGCEWQDGASSPASQQRLPGSTSMGGHTSGNFGDAGLLALLGSFVQQHMNYPGLHGLSSGGAELVSDERAEVPHPFRIFGKF